MKKQDFNIKNQNKKIRQITIFDSFLLGMAPTCM